MLAVVESGSHAPQIHYVAVAGFEPLTLLPFSPRAGITGMDHYTQPPALLFYNWGLLRAHIKFVPFISGKSTIGLRLH